MAAGQERAFRKPESFAAETKTRGMLAPFLSERGFTIRRDHVKVTGPARSQTIDAVTPDARNISMRVKLCWHKDGTRNRQRRYSAVQLLANIKKGDWLGSIQGKVDREKAQGITHFLFVQREAEDITHAALVPVDELLPVWKAQRAASAALAKLGDKVPKGNHAENGSSPTIWLRDTNAPTVPDALWNHAGVIDIARMKMAPKEPFNGLSVAALFARVERQHFLDAIARINAGVQNDFGESTRFDLVFKGKRYAPKELGGLALQELTGRKFGPQDFSSGDDSACFAAIRRTGFTVVRKVSGEVPAFSKVVSEILTLQTQYTSKNTLEMQRRGELIRNLLPAHFNDHLDTIEPPFSTRGYSCEVEGSDGKGMKVESPWVRIFDPAQSPSATTGWYIVTHFSRKGEAFFLTLGCGATTFKDGSLYDVNPEKLKEQVEWARSLLKGKGRAINRFADQIALHGNDLSRQFERATALCKRYEAASFKEEEFWADVRELAPLLVEIYDYSALGKAPISDDPAVGQARAAIEQGAGKKRASAGGQGRGLSYPERRAIELRAMKVAEEELKKRGYSDLDDVSDTKSYDFEGIKEGKKRFIEVKGTTSAHYCPILLTAPEQRFHAQKIGETALIVVYDIDLRDRKGTPTAEGGAVMVFDPWVLDQWDFVPTGFEVSIKAA